MTTRNTRLHPDAVIPVADAVVETDDGATTVAVPTGASGIMIQNLAANGSYWSFDGAMTGADEGFKLGSTRELIWFSPTHVTNVYLYLHANDSVIYQFVAPAAY